MLVSRKDKNEHSNRGGIAAFARSDLRNIVCIAKSIHAERAWHFLHTDVGSIAIINWYRPGSSPIRHAAHIEARIITMELAAFELWKCG